MSDKTRYSTLSDAEINAKLAEKMGRLVVHIGGELLMQTTEIEFEPWSPCTSRHDLAVVVTHIRDERQKLEILTSRLLEIGWFDAHLLTCPPRIIAEACLEVMEG